MRRMINVHSFFRWLNQQEKARRISASQKLFQPQADALEARRLLTLDVWIQNDNNLMINASNDVAQYLQVEYQPAIGVNPGFYTIRSLVTTENFSILTNNPDGLTVSKSDYNPVTTQPAELTVVENTGLLTSVSISTGSGRDRFEDFLGSDLNLATLYISSGDGSDQVIKFGSFSSSNLIVDGGAGEDLLSVSVITPTAQNFTQNFFTTAVDPTSVIFDSAFDDGTDFFYINIQSSNIESITNAVNAPNAAYLQTLNGQFSTAFGNLSNTPLKAIESYIQTDSAEFEVIGYETADQMNVVSTNVGTPGVMMQASGLPTSNFYLQTSSKGVMRLQGLSGNDSLTAESGVEALVDITLDGGDGDDYLSADATLIGGPGNDTLQGGSGNDSLDGGLGDDTFLISNGTDTLNGGSGFDRLALSGIVGSNNTYMITQNSGVPATISINGTSSNVSMSSIDQIFVMGSTSTDNLIVLGNSNLPVPIFAMLGAGNDVVNTFSASAQQTVTAFGEAGQDTYSAGQGTDNFYGGDDFDIFTMLGNSVISSDNFDGGSGSNQVQVQNVALGTSTIDSIPGGYVISNLAPGSASLTARNISSIQVLMNSASLGFQVSGTDSDEVIRTFDSGSALVPPLPANTIKIVGLGVELQALNVLSGHVITIHGQGGNDTFEALGRSNASVVFSGDSGDDVLLVTQESVPASFSGGAGNNRVSLSGTMVNDTISLSQAASGSPYQLTLNGVTSTVSGFSDSILNGFDGIDTITVSAVDALNVTVSGGDGNDTVNLSGVVSPGSTAFVDGGSGNDTLTGSTAGVVVLSGGLGNDGIVLVGAGTVFGDGGNDTITGSSGNDTLSGGSGDDQINGGNGDDLVDGDSGLDTITSGAGEDTLNGGLDSDWFVIQMNGQTVFMDGGDGNDLLWLQGTAGDDSVTMSSVLGASTVKSGAMDLSLTDTESYYIDLGDQTDSLSLVDMDEVQIETVEFAAGGGLNTVNVGGMLGDNDVNVGIESSGTVLATGLGYVLKLSGTTASDLLSIDGGSGNDVLKAEPGVEGLVGISLSGGDGDDILSADATLSGGSGDDLFYVPTGTNTVIGGSGFDTIVVLGSGGDDTIAVSQTAAGVVSLTVNAATSSNTVSEVEKIDVSGLAGNDTISLSGDGTVQIDVDAGSGNDTVDASGMSALGVTISGGEGDDLLTGSPQGDSLFGGSGNDSINGGAGNDYLIGDSGLDFITSASGNDTILGGSESDTVTITLGSQTLYIDGGTGKDLIWINGTSGNDDLTVTSNLGAVVITADGTTKSALVDVEDFYVNLGNEDDSMTIADMTQAQIGLGVFAFLGGTGTNTVNVIGTTNNDNITIGINWDVQVALLGLGYELELRNVDTADLLNVTGQSGNDTIMAATGVEGLVSLQLSGGDGDDILSADATLLGGLGNDTLSGGLGNDSMDGGAGDDLFLLSGGLDTIIGGTGFDIVLVSGVTGQDNGISVVQNAASPVVVQVNSAIYSANLSTIDQISVQGSGGNDSLVVSGNLVSPIPVFGMLGAGLDFVDTTGAAASQLTTAYGEAGVDRFVSGPGTDEFYGGSEFDEFVVSSSSVNSNDLFDGGTGYNALTVESVAGGTTILRSIPSGFEVSNTAGSGMTTALNIGSVSVDSGGLGVSLFGSNGDDAIRTFDSGSDLVPSLPVGTLLVTGLPGDVTVTGMTVSSVVDIHGEGGNDTFQSLGNATGTVNFYGDSGDDVLLVTQESVPASFSGGAGTDAVNVTGTEFNDVLTFDSVGGQETVTYNAVVNAVINDAEILNASGLGGNDALQVASVAVSTGLTTFNLSGNEGNDYLAAWGITSGNFVMDAGSGDDSISGPDGSSRVTIYGGEGSDSISAGLAAAAIYGGDGNDSINGSDGLDSISGGDGDDVINGGGANDQISAGAGDDIIIWSIGGGNDSIDGGTGQDSLVAYGDLSAANNYQLRPQVAFSDLFDVLIAGNIIGGGDIEQVSLTGGAAGDSFTVGNLSQTSITLVDLNLQTDLAADSVALSGTDGNDQIIVSGSTQTTVSGLPWLVRISGAAFSASTLIDGLLIDSGLGEDLLVGGADLTSPVLVTMRGGQGPDEFRLNSPALGDNPNRMTVIANDDGYADLIGLRNGRNQVFGGSSDVIHVMGTEADDTMAVDGTLTPGRVQISVNGQSSSNDLTGFSGRVLADGSGGNDAMAFRGYGLGTSVYGGAGSDLIDASGMAVAVTIFGGDGDDQISGGSASDVIDTGNGLNEVAGLGGNDTIVGGSDTDGYYWQEGDGFDFLASSGGLDYIFAYGGDGVANSFVVDRFFTTYRMIYNGDVNQGFQAEEISSANFIAGAGSTASGSVQDMTGIHVDRLLFDFSQAASASVSVDGSISDDELLVDVNSYSSDLLEIAGLSYQFRMLGTPTPANNALTVHGLAGNDSLKTTAAADALALMTLDGGAGDDLLSADAILLGGPGNDTFVVPVGVNTIDGGDGFDTIAVDGTDGSDSIDVSQAAGIVTITVNSNTSTNTVTNVELIEVNAFAANDQVLLVGDSSAITATVYAGEGDDQVDASGMEVGITAYGGYGNDQIVGGTASDTIYGGAGSDQLVGLGGADYLYGEAGSDELDGGMGRDYLEGGDDADLLLPGKNNAMLPEFVDGGSGLDQVSFDFNATIGLIGRTAGFVNVGELGAVDPPVAFNAVDVENMLITVDSTVPGSTGYDLTIQDLTGSQVDFVRVAFVDVNDSNKLVLEGTQLDDTINANTVLPPGGEPEASVIMPWGTVWGYTPSATAPTNTLVLDGRDGNDMIKASYNLNLGAFGWNVQLVGNNGNDILNGDATLLGGSGNDTFIVPVGINTIDGGDGFDIIQVDGTLGNDIIEVDQSGGTVNLTVNAETSTNTTTNVELIQVDAMSGNDFIRLTGTDTINTIVHAGDGNNSINALGYAALTTLYGGSGNDSIVGGNANDLIESGAGNDTINGMAGSDTILAGDGSDLIFWTSTGGGDDTIDGGSGDDQLVVEGNLSASNAMTLTPNTNGGPSTAPGLGIGNANMIKVTNNTQTIITAGSLEAVSLMGGGGCDSFGVGNLQTTDVRVVDVIFNTAADGGVVSTYATNLPDTITVTADAPDQIGVNGLAVPVRVFNTKPETAVVVHAGFGSDTIEIDPQAEAQAIIVVDGGSGHDTISGGSVIIGGNGNNLLVGSDGPNTIVGGTGSDTIYGLGANDLLFGDAEVINVDIPGPNCDYLAGILILPTSTGAPDLIEGGEGNDSINGNIGPDTMIGGNGDDRIGELTFNSIFFPEPGDDIIDGGEGNNCVFSGDGNDQVAVGGGQNLVVLGTGNDSVVTGDGNNTVFAGDGDDYITTGSGNDVVVLGAGNDTAHLNDGNDLAWGEDGNDFIVGGMGDDTLYGGNGNDTLWGGTHATKPLGKGQWHAVIRPLDGNDVIAGEMGRDQVDGGTGNNVMDAGADNIRETIVGSGGWDTAYIHLDERPNQDVLMNHSRRYTLIKYGSMPVAAVPATPTDCSTPVQVVIPNPLAGTQSKSQPKSKARPKPVQKLFRRLTR